jgi:arsenate reductase
MKVSIYHNPRCSKSRATLALLREQGIEPEIVEYLKDPPSRQTLEQLLDMLDVEPLALMRTKEKEFRELGLEKDEADRETLIQALLDHPRLMERPIVVHGRKAALGRPPENVLEIL